MQENESKFIENCSSSPYCTTDNGANMIKVVENVPFTHSMKLFSFNNKVYFIQDNKIFVDCLEYS